MEIQKIPRKKKFTHFIGIDISKDTLDFALLRGKDIPFHKEIVNDDPSIRAFLQELKMLAGFKMAKAIFCMEDTGFYNNHLLNVLSKKRVFIVVENPVKIINSLGILRGKDDKTDAIRIAKYAHKNQGELREWEPRRQVINELAALAVLRERIKTVINIMRVPLKEQKGFVNKTIQKQCSNLCVGSIDILKKEEKNVMGAIEKLIASDEKVKRLTQLIISVPNVGVITAIQIIIHTNEFKNINNPKKFACYAGVAPFKRESGNSVRRARVSPVSNRKMKALLHVCAMGAIRTNKELTAYYERKTKTEGKAKMAVLNAIRNKLVLRVFACVNQDRFFVKEYTRQVKPEPAPATEITVANATKSSNHFTVSAQLLNANNSVI